MPLPAASRPSMPCGNAAQFVGLACLAADVTLVPSVELHRTWVGWRMAEQTEVDWPTCERAMHRHQPQCGRYPAGVEEVPGPRRPGRDSRQA
jgi:hypothetical protein